MQNLFNRRKLKKKLRVQLFPSPVNPSLHIHMNVVPDGIHSPFVGSQSLPSQGSISKSIKLWEKFYSVLDFHDNQFIINHDSDFLSNVQTKGFKIAS